MQLVDFRLRQSAKTQKEIFRTIADILVLTMFFGIELCVRCLVVTASSNGLGGQCLGTLDYCWFSAVRDDALLGT